MHRAAVVLMAFGLAGCAKSADINFVNGRAFMMGDDSCARYRLVSPDVVQCFTSDDRPVELRRALNQQEMQFVLMRQQLQAQQMQSLNQSIQQVGTSFGQVPQPQYNYTAPQVMPIAPPGGSQVRCITAGIYTNCRY
ncbi:MAG TPA: hypothetical protein VNR89_17940 [Roseomonas sp.]|nr:hypothetical protein [Roseomonas sp.]